MHDIEPFYSWRNLYSAADDPKSPFFGRNYSEFVFSHKIYNYFIHPQWDAFGSDTLYMKILYVSYRKKYCIIELIGEWNDLLYNDIMFLKREIADELIEQGITQFILIGENVLNFHFSEDDYYQEWAEDVDNGWIACLNMHPHVLADMQSARLHYYMCMGGALDNFAWRSKLPDTVYEQVFATIHNRI